jgi:hypothetical protein
MAVSMWTPDKLRSLALPQLKILRDNASKRGVTDIVELCDAEIAARPAVARTTGLRSAATKEEGDIVIEYHFVCRGDKGVTVNNNGTFWSGSWGVSEEVVKTSMKYGARFALHESKGAPSYRQGKIVEYTKVEAMKNNKPEARIDFLVESETTPLDWAGAGVGEKGYKRAKRSDLTAAATSE